MPSVAENSAAGTLQSAGRGSGIVATLATTVAANSGGTRNSPAKAVKSALRLSGSGPRSRPARAQKATQAALRPPQSLPPEGPERLDGLLGHGDVRGQRDVLAIRHEPGRQVEILRERPRVPAADRPPARRAGRTCRSRALGGPVGRPSAALAGQVHGLLLALRSRQPRDRCVPWLARNLDGVCPAVAVPARIAPRGIPARPACRRRSHRPPRPAGSSAPTPTAPFVRGVRSRSRRRTITCGASPQPRWRGQPSDRSIRRRRRPARSAASHRHRRSRCAQSDDTAAPITDSSLEAGSTIETKGRPSARLRRSPRSSACTSRMTRAPCQASQPT